MTHAELVDRAARWLLNTRRCKLVIVGAQPWSCHEHPDAIGWLPLGESIVVECKVSLQDFRADHYKRWRMTTTGAGFYRYYMTPSGVQSSPTSDDDGLLEVRGRTVRVIREARPRQKRDWTAELSMLLAQVSNGRRLIGANEAEGDDVG